MIESITQIISFAVAILSIIVAVTTFVINIIRLRKIRKEYREELTQIYENKDAQRAEEEKMKIIKCDRCGKEITDNVTEWDGFDLCAECAAEMSSYEGKIKDLTAAKEEAYAEFIAAREKYVAADKALADAQRKVGATGATGRPGDPIGK